MLLGLTWLTLTVLVHLMLALPVFVVRYSVKSHLCGHRATVINITTNYVLVTAIFLYNSALWINITWGVSRSVVEWRNQIPGKQHFNC